jgi:phytoene dehydrogenase-like protein
MKESADVVVIGGGLAGLAAATYLGRAGKRVVLLEKSRDLGGRAVTQSHGEFRMNLGPHALYRGGAGLPILKELGVHLRGRPPSTSGLLALDRGGVHAFPGGVLSLFTTKLLRFSERIEAARVLQKLTSGINPEPLQRTTVQAWIERTIRAPAVRRLVAALVRLTTYTNAPERLSAGAAVTQLKIALTKNVLYLDGGWQTLVDGLTSAARESGVTLRTGTKAQSIEIHDDTVRAVTIAEADSLLTSAVIIAAPPHAVRALADRIPELADVARDAIPVRAACLDIALSSLPRPRSLFALGIDQPTYFSVHSATAKLAPHGGALIHAAKYLNPDEDTDPKSDEAELLSLCDQIQPGFRELTVERRFLPSMIVMNDMARATAGGASARTPITLPRIKNLYLAGDWIGPEGMLADTSLITAARAANHILTHKT